MKKEVIAIMIGNALEWYDFALYSHFSYLISDLYFPNHDPISKMILTFGIFAAGFIMRPVGAIIFGLIGDKKGRKFSLSLSILLMAIPTTLIGMLPTYNQIGIAAPILLTLIRIIQGFSMGGEIGGMTTFVIECAPSNKRGLFGSYAFISTCLGILLGSLIATSCAYFLSQQNFISWGWRLPFLLGIIIGFVGYYIRLNLSDSEIYLQTIAKAKTSINPFNQLFSNYKLKLLQAIVIYAAMVAPFFTLTSFINNFMSSLLKFNNSTSLTITSLNIITLIISLPIGGYLGDYYGRKKIMIISALMLALSMNYLLTRINNASAITSASYQLIFAWLLGLYSGSVYTVIIELFPTLIRYTSVGLAMNISTTLFGGTIPIIAANLIANFELSKAIDLLGFFLAFCSIIAILGLYWLEDIYKQELK